MTKQSPTHQQQQPENVNGRSRKPHNININTSGNNHGWSNQSTLNQLLTPVQILAETDLQNELDFYATTQFRYTSSNSTPSTPAISSGTTNRPNYFEHQATTTFNNSSITSTPQLNIPVDSNDYAASNPSLLHSTTAVNSSNNENHSNHNLNSLSMTLFDHPSQQSTDTSSQLLLNHEPLNVYGRNPPTSNRTIPSVMNSMYSSSTTPINSTPTSPITFNPQGNEHYFESNQQDQSTDRFAAMFLSGESSLSGKQSTKRAQQQKGQQFRFKKEVVIPPALKQRQQQQQEHYPLNFMLLSKHNMEQEQLAGIPPSATKAKGKQSKGKKKAVPKKKAQPKEDHDMSNDDEEEDEPVIGDGAQSYSSIGSSGSRSSLTKDDKRRRNTAASARFRIKKKMREQALQSTACQMTDKAKRMEQRMHELETEIKWLKALVVEKNESRLEQLVRERPAVSIAFPSSPSSGSSSAINGSYQQTTSNNDAYEEEEEEEGDDDDDEDYQQY